MSFLVKVVMYHCVVTFLGGRGQFGRYAYLLASIAVPMTFLYSFLDFLPLAVARLVAVLPGSSFMAGQFWNYVLSDSLTFAVLPGYSLMAGHIWYYALSGSVTIAASLIVLVYWHVLIYFSTKVEHGMTWWRAVIGVVTSYLVVFVLKTVWPYGYLGLFEAVRILRR